jgi:hypothetical protein
MMHQTTDHPLSLIFFVLALVLFGLAGVGIPEAPRFRYIGWGLFAFLLSMLVPW